MSLGTKHTNEQQGCPDYHVYWKCSDITLRNMLSLKSENMAFMDTYQKYHFHKYLCK